MIRLLPAQLLRLRLVLCVLVQLTLLATSGDVLAQARHGINATVADAVESGVIHRLVKRQADPTIQVSDLDEREPEIPYVPGEFERFVQRVAGTPVKRLGAELMTGGPNARTADLAISPPPEYVLAPGDEVLLLLWGSVDADLRLILDRNGRIQVPRVGAIQLAGVRHGDLANVIERRVAQVFKNFQLSASLGQLRSMRVFVTGFVERPGVYNVAALSTVVGVLMRAGGPSAAGSFRQIELRRNSAPIALIDLYDLLLRGDKSSDRLLQSGDVVHVGPVGVQVGVVGSVNRPAVIELASQDRVEDALRMAGGFSAVADRSRVSIERLRERSQQRVSELLLPKDGRSNLDHGDVLRAFSSTEVVPSTLRQTKRIRIDGEVQRPGDYLMPAGSTLQDAISIAGGLNTSAFLFGTQFIRESVRATQQENYNRMLHELETDMARTAGSQAPATGELAEQQQFRNASAAKLIERLRALQPSGRIVVQLAPGASELPALVVEDGDRLYIPPVPSTVGVFGSVFNSGSYLYGDGRVLGDYLRLAGGPTKGADKNGVFVVRANGQVISGRQLGDDAWWANGNRVSQVRAEPGDALFVPEELDKSTFVQSSKDWTQILYQFGIGLAGIRSVTR